MSRASLVRLVLLLAAALLAGDAAWAQAPELAQLGEVQPEAEGSRLSTALEIALLLTALSLLPAILITVTSFTRIVIVLSFVRRALSVNELPPNPVLIGLALQAGPEILFRGIIPLAIGVQVLNHAQIGLGQR